jgi:DnaJ-class molecular chaperone
VIVLEITDESGVTHYQLLELDQTAIAAMGEKDASIKVDAAARAQKSKHNKAAMRGDEAAEEALKRVNEAAMVLKMPKTRKEYDESLASGAGDSAAALQPQRIGAPFFWERADRYRVIEQLMPVMAEVG